MWLYGSSTTESIYITQYNPLEVISYNEFDPQLPQVKALRQHEALRVCFTFIFILGLVSEVLFVQTDQCLSYLPLCAWH